jgi:uncharacterized protein (TIGR03083 family)
MPTTAHDYQALLWAESADLGSLLDELDDDAFDDATLCAGWKVRDVVSHMLWAHTTPLPSVVLLALKSGFNVPKASLTTAVTYGSSHSVPAIRAEWHRVVDERVMKGLGKLVPTKEAFVDHLIHHQDIRRPLGLPRSIPVDRLAAALDAMPAIGGLVKSKKRMAGLRWTATDIDWTFGDGPDITGPAEALILLSSGRRAPIAEVSGAGIPTLEKRLAR